MFEILDLRTGNYRIVDSRLVVLSSRSGEEKEEFLMDFMVAQKQALREIEKKEVKHASNGNT